MPPLDHILSPQAQQAVIAALIVAIGWMVSGAQSRRRDERQRHERVVDTQRALLAEIRANFAAFDADGIEELRQHTQAQIAAGRLPLLPTDSNDRVFRAIIDEIPILPADVIDPVILYYRQHNAIAALAADFRSLGDKANGDKTDGRATAMFDDYLDMNLDAIRLGGHAIKALTASLEGRKPDESDDAQHNPATLAAELNQMRARLNTPDAGQDGPSKV